MGRFESRKQMELYQFLASLVYKRMDEIAGKTGKPSAVKIGKLITDELGYTVSQQALFRLLKKDLSKYKDVREKTDADVLDIVKQLTIIKSILDDESATPSARTRAANAYSNLMKTKLSFKKQLSEDAFRRAEVEKPTYEVRMGKYKSCSVKCPKCGNIFYDIPDKKKEEVEKTKKEFKVGKGQATLEEATTK